MTAEKAEALSRSSGKRLIVPLQLLRGNIGVADGYAGA